MVGLPYLYMLGAAASGETPPNGATQSKGSYDP